MIKTRKHIPKLYWLIHHQVLLEVTTEPIQERIEFIKEDKPKWEQPIRLKWMKPVKRPDLLPKIVLERYKEYRKTGLYRSLDKLCKSIKVRRNQPKIRARHKKEYSRLPV